MGNNKTEINQVEEGVFIASVVNPKAEGPTLATASKPAEKNIEIQKAKQKIEVVPWGFNNNLPQFIEQKIQKAPMVKQAIKKAVASIYGKGLHVFKTKASEGKRQVELLTRADNDEATTTVFDFIDNNILARYFRKAIRSFVVFERTFPVIHCSVDGSQVNEIRHLDPHFVRMVKMRNGVIDRLVYSTKFPDTPKHFSGAEKDAEIYWVVDPLKVDMTALKKRIKNGKHASKFVLLSDVTTFGHRYYQDPDWFSLLMSGWVDVSTSIANAKSKLLENQLSTRFQIKVHQEYWTARFKDWEGLTQKEQEERRETFLSNMVDKLTGTDNQNNAIMTAVVEGMEGKPQDLIQIEEIGKRDIKGGDFILDVDTANNETLKAFGINPALVGHGATGSKQGHGSGSDIREAFAVDIGTNQEAHDVLLEPLKFVQAWNGWDKTVEFGFPAIHLTTLDKNPTGQQTQL